MTPQIENAVVFTYRFIPFACVIPSVPNSKLAVNSLLMTKFVNLHEDINFHQGVIMCIPDALKPTNVTM